MKGPLTKLGVLGPGHYRNLLEELRKAQARSTKLAQELDLARADAKTVKGKADEAAKALRDSQAEAARHMRRAEKLTGDLEKVKTEFQRKYEQECRKLAEVDQKRARALEDLQQRLGEAERALTVARETLMAVEVKLDILEGAANVLDVRTRTMSGRALPAGSGAAV
jgi:chromosome segregation ATPase